MSKGLSFDELETGLLRTEKPELPLTMTLYSIASEAIAGFPVVMCGAPSLKTGPEIVVDAGEGRWSCQLLGLQVSFPTSIVAVLQMPDRFRAENALTMM